MGKVYYIEDYKDETMDQLWDRIAGIRAVMSTVLQDKRSSVMDMEMVMRLEGLKDFLIDKCMAYLREQGNGQVETTEATGSTGA